MTALQEQAISYIENAPEEEVIYILTYFRNSKRNIKKKKRVNNKNHSPAYCKLERYFGMLDGHIDYKKELEEALVTKYENIG